jgi:uracil-DNA glycosylase family 4
VFTGDRSGDWLYGALHRAGFANQPHSVSRDDGLRLRGAYVAAAARCAPPANKPTPEELRTCRDYLVAEVEVLRANAGRGLPLVVIALGAVGFAAVLAVFETLGTPIARPRPAFGHLAEHRLAADAVVLCSYHPSQQNTQTGLLTQPMFDAVFTRARELLDG